jgi:hypothetical protein
VTVSQLTVAVHAHLPEEIGMVVGPFTAMRIALGAAADTVVIRRTNLRRPPVVRSFPRRGMWEAAAVAALLLLTVAIRVAGLPGDGPPHGNEGWSIVNGRFLVTLLMHPARWATFMGLFSPGLTLNQHHVFPLGNDWKPGHDLAIGIIGAAGVSPENLTWYAGLIGVAMVIVVAALAWQRWGAPAAAVAGVFAGGIPLSIAYGHRLLAEADGLLGIALLLYLLDGWWTRRPSRPRLFVTIFVFLATLTLSYRFLSTLLPIFIILASLSWWYRRHDLPPKPHIERLIIVCLVPAAGLVVLYLLVAGANALGLPALPHALRYWFVRGNGGLTLPFRFADFYIRTFWDFGGPVFIAAVGLGCVALVWRWKRLDPLAAIALGSFLGILLFFSAAPDKAPRAIAMAIPFAALVVSRAVALVRGKAQQWALALTLCGICLASGWIGSGFARDASGIGQAGRWLASHPGPLVAYRPGNYLLFVDNRPDTITNVQADRRWEIVQPDDPAHRLVVPNGDLTMTDLRQDGVRWAVVDADALYYGGSVFKRLVACGQPTVEFADPADWSRLAFLEVADIQHLDYEMVLQKRTQALAASNGHQTIRIYDLAGPGTANCSAS